MRSWTFVALFAMTVTRAAVLIAQEPPAPQALKVPYATELVVAVDNPALQQRAEEYNDLIADLQMACREYDERNRPFIDVLKLCLRLNAIYQEVLLTPAKRETFEQQQLTFVRSVENEVKERHKHQGATALDMHRARFLRLTVEMKSGR
jgi:hypothetical protein